jgi:general secretion pathway protein L
MSPLRLILLPRVEGDPIQVRVVADGRVIQRGVLAPDQGGASDLPTVAIVPGEDATCRWLALPGGRQAQAAAAAGFLLDDQIAAPRDTLHIAVGPPEADGQRLAVVVDRARMQTWSDLIAALNVRVSAIIPEHLLLPEPEGDEVVYAAVAEGVAAVRGRRLALTCEEDLLAAVAGEGARQLSPDEADALMAWGAAAPLLDLRQGAFAPAGARVARGGVNRLAVIAVLVGLSILALPAVQAVRHHLAARSAQAEAQALAGPGEGEPAVRLREKLDRLQAAERFPAAAAALFSAVESIDGMELQGLLYGGDGALRVSVAHANYSDTEQFRTRLSGEGLDVEESSTVTEGGRIISDLVVRPQR